MPKNTLDLIPDDQAFKYLEQYFGTDEPDSPHFTGSRFETFGGGGDAVDPHRITADDLIAVSMLSVHVPARAVLGITGRFADQITELLSRLPVDADLHQLNCAEFTSLLDDKHSPGHQLWDLLRQNSQKGNRWNVGPTTASKIMARKRPKLIPIYDSIIKQQVGSEHPGGYWKQWYEALHGSANSALVERLVRIRAESGQSHLSLLRVLDIILWQHGRQGQDVLETVGDVE